MKLHEIVMLESKMSNAHEVFGELGLEDSEMDAVLAFAMGKKDFDDLPEDTQLKLEAKYGQMDSDHEEFEGKTDSARVRKELRKDLE